MSSAVSPGWIASSRAAPGSTTSRWYSLPSSPTRRPYHSATSPPHAVGGCDLGLDLPLYECGMRCFRRSEIKLGLTIWPSDALAIDQSPDGQITRLSDPQDHAHRQ